MGFKIEVFQNVEQNVGESKTLMTYRQHGALKTHNDIQFASDKKDKHKKAGKINHSKLWMCSWFLVKALMFLRGSKMKDSFVKIHD